MDYYLNLLKLRCLVSLEENLATEDNSAIDLANNNVPEGTNVDHSSENSLANYPVVIENVNPFRVCLAC